MVYKGVGKFTKTVPYSAEGLWLHCKSVDKKRRRRKEYLEKRRVFKRAVRKAIKEELQEPEMYRT